MAKGGATPLSDSFIDMQAFVYALANEVSTASVSPRSPRPCREVSVLTQQTTPNIYLFQYGNVTWEKVREGVLAAPVRYKRWWLDLVEVSGLGGLGLPLPLFCPVPKGERYILTDPTAMLRTRTSK